MNTRPRPTRVMRIGLIVGAAGAMLVIVVGGLFLGNIGGALTPWLLNLGILVAAGGAVVLAFGGVWYFRRARSVMARREADLEWMGDAESGGTPAEQAELPPEKRHEMEKSGDSGGDEPGKAAPQSA